MDRARGAAAPDPTWTADGHVSDRWLPASPSGRLDAFEWRVPLAGIGKPSSEKPAIEPEAAAPAAPMLAQKTEAPIAKSKRCRRRAGRARPNQPSPSR